VILGEPIHAVIRAQNGAGCIIGHPPIHIYSKFTAKLELLPCKWLKLAVLSAMSVKARAHHRHRRRAFDNPIIESELRVSPHSFRYCLLHRD